MHALVKFLENTVRGKKMRVTRDKILFDNLSKKGFNPLLKYNVIYTDGQIYKAQILFLEESKEALEEAIKANRPKEVPVNLLQTASEDDGNEPLAKKMKLQTSKSNLPAMKIKKEKSLTKSASSLNQKKNELKLVIDSNSNNEATAEIDALETSTVAPEMETHCQSIPKENTESNITNSLPTADSLLPTNHSIPSTSKDDNKNRNKPFIINIEKLPTREKLDEQRRKVTKLMKDLAEMKAKYEKAKDKNAVLTNQVSQLQKDLEEHRKTSLNFQKLWIEKHGEKKTVEAQLEDASYEVDSKVNFVPIGHFRESDETFHIGRGYRLSKAAYNTILMKSSTPSVFVANEIVAVFGEATLLKSTRTGKKSNRSLKKKDNEPQNLDVEQLDSSKVAACKDFFHYWLNIEYKKMANPQSFSIFDELANFNEYMSRKISSLKRVKSKKRTFDYLEQSADDTAVNCSKNDQNEQKTGEHDSLNPERNTNDVEEFSEMSEVDDDFINSLMDADEVDATKRDKLSDTEEDNESCFFLSV